MSNDQQSEEAIEKKDWKKIGPCLYRYKEGHYYGIFKVNGRQHKVCLETKDLPLARRKLAAARDAAGRTDVGLRGQTLDVLSEKFLGSLRCSNRTRLVKRREVSMMLRDWPPTAPRVVHRIRKSHLEQWLAGYSDSLAASTINSLVSLARQMFEMALADRVIAESPAAHIKYRKRAKPLRLTPTYEQFRSIVADLRAPERHNTHGQEETADYVEFAGEAGLGQAEICGLRRCDVDPSGGVITCFRRKTETGFAVPIYPKVLPILLRRLGSADEKPEARLFRFDDCKKGLEAACKRLKFSTLHASQSSQNVHFASDRAWR